MTQSVDVEVRNLTVTRGTVVAVVDANLNLQSGIVTGLLGPSGSGKTTLMRAIVGSQRIKSGTVTVLGHAAGSAAIRSRVGYMAQAAALYLDLTVLENVRYFSQMLNLPTGRVEAVIENVDMGHRAKALVRDLSGGEKSRVSLAVALLGEPPVLILDEPTVGLDPLLRRSLWRLFRDLAAGGTTLLVSSHVMDEASRCDQLVLMRAGRILFEGTQEQLQAQAGVNDIESAFIAMAQDPS